MVGGGGGGREGTGVGVGGYIAVLNAGNASLSYRTRRFRAHVAELKDQPVAGNQ